ncbi:putative nuclease HARBI1 [Rhagoletis pomonella]|uniref:putative nuclease HARBI1 n=1 Tax=Rhagoletis pomonella TaxID=28610 RepID=UPI00177C4289|nr:putative nuclease HARBI1 [Rhagoletis pomonella]XP_036340415.1 putative nuclease HARBI1 [Rhagoletis pomonella]
MWRLSISEYYLLADSAYPCTSNVVTPYRDNGHLTHQQKRFNIKLSSGRVAIEHTFGILKQRFRQLYYCKLGVEKLCHFIRTCCVLHNIANQDDLEFHMGETSETEEGVEGYVHTSANLRGNTVREAVSREILSR